MQFQVPQFIKRELKIVGPLTFKQFLFVAMGFLGCAIFYFFLMQKSAFLFVVLSILILFASIAMAFVKIQGIPLPTVITNFFLFSISKKTYLWKKKTFSPQIIEVKKEPKQEKSKEETILGPSADKSQLEDLSTKLETGMRDIE